MRDLTRVSDKGYKHDKINQIRRLIERLMSAKSCEDATQIASTYFGFEFRVDLIGRENAGLGGAPVTPENPLVWLEAGSREFWIEVS